MHCHPDCLVRQYNCRTNGATPPDLPGCVATGATVEETECLLREAIALHLEGMREDGIPIPEPSSVVDYLEMETCV